MDTIPALARDIANYTSGAYEMMYQPCVMISNGEVIATDEYFDTFEQAKMEARVLAADLQEIIGSDLEFTPTAQEVVGLDILQ